MGPESRLIASNWLLIWLVTLPTTALSHGLQLGTCPNLESWSPGGMSSFSIMEEHQEVFSAEENTVTTRQEKDHLLLIMIILFIVMILLLFQTPSKKTQTLLKGGKLPTLSCALSHSTMRRQCHDDAIVYVYGS